MPLDPYSLCPGGTGKKIKFCCHELLGDLDQIDRLVDGEQIQAALEQVVRLCEKHPGKACLLATRTKLELAAKQFNEAAVTSRAFLDAYPDNPLALGHAAVTAALNDNLPEAASLFDRGREAAAADMPDDLVRIAMTLVQVASQVGQFGLAESILEWLTEQSLGSEEERGILAEAFLAAGPPPALRIRMPLVGPAEESPWRFEFETALKHAASWRLSKAVKTFSSLKGVAGDSPAVFTNIALLCEQLARPLEAAEAWLRVAELRAASGDATGPDEAVEATGRAVALEGLANPERSPVIRYQVLRGTLAGDLDLLEDALRKSDHFEANPVDRSRWISQGAVPPRSSWRIYAAAAEAGSGQRLLGAMLIHGKQTDRDAEVSLQGLAPDIGEAKPLAEQVLHCTLEPAEQPPGLPTATPLNYLAGSQFRMVPPPPPTTPPADGEDAPIDRLVAEQQRFVARRFVSLWPDTALPELLGKTAREAVAAGGESRRRVEAIINDAEATELIPSSRDVWPDLRTAVGLPEPQPIELATPLGEVPPQRWLRLDLAQVELDHLRGLLLAAADVGYSLTAERVAEKLLAREGITDADRWQALGVLESRARTTTRRLEILAQIRSLAKTMQADEGMLDVAELRLQLQRGDQPAFLRVLDRIRRLHGQNPRVANGVAQVLMEAGIDINAVAGAGGMPAGAGGAAPAAAPAVAPGKLWTPGSEPAAGSGEKPAIWTP